MPARLASMDLSDDNAATPRAANGYAPAPEGGVENATGAGRRKSARVGRKPKLFGEEQGTAAVKRKRADVGREEEDEEDDASGGEGDGGDSESESESSEEGEADPEEVKERKRRARKVGVGRGKGRPGRPPAAKKVKKSGPLVVGKTKPKAAANGPTPKPSKPRARKAGTTEEGEGLFAEVFTSGKTLDAVAAAWVEKYKESNPEGLRDLINFVLRSAGCELEVTVHDIEDQDNVTGRLTDLQEEYQAQNITDYPLISKSRMNPPFRQTLTGFIKSLILTAHASNILYEDLALIENMQVWVTTMSSSAIRPFRHTATVVSLAVVSTLCEVVSEIAEATAKTLRQMESEKKKARVNKARVSALQAKVDEGGQNRETVETFIKDIFDTVFVHRYRDVDPKIRADCVQALGHWIATLPELFFEGQYLRYLGWVLSDTAAPTRLEVIRQLRRLFKNQNNVGGLRHFIERFRPRLVEMATRDADPGVRAATVEVLDSIREAGMLEPDDIDTVGRLIFDSEVRVRKAVVDFFAENINDLYDSKIEELGGEEAIEEVLVGDNDEDFENPRIAWVKLKCLVEVLSSYDSEDHEELPSQIEKGPPGGSDVLVAAGVESRFSLAAQALYEKIPEIREWETLAGYLLFDHSSTSAQGSDEDVEKALKLACKLDEKEEVILLEVLNAAVRLSLTRTEDQEPSKKGKKKKTPKRDSLEHQETAARHLAQMIPALLNKFGAVPDAASAVLRLEHVLNLDVFQEPGQESGAYSSLLDNINKQFLTHADQAVLVEASAALLHARSFEELEEVTEGKVQALWEDTVGTLHALLAGSGGAKDISKRGNLGASLLTGLSNTVRRLGNLASISDPVEAFEKAPVAAGKRKAGSAPSSDDAPVKILLKLLPRGEWAQESEAITEAENELVQGAMKALLFYFMWKVKALQDTLARGEEVADLDIETLQECREEFVSGLTGIMRTRGGTDALRLVAAGTLVDLFTLFATLRQPVLDRGPDGDAAAGARASEVAETGERVLALVREVPGEVAGLLVAVFAAWEKAFARKTRRTLEAGEEDEPEDDEEDEESGDEDEDEDAEAERLSQALLLEQRLCELAGKFVLAVIAGVLDASGAEKGKVRERLQRNRGRLGHSFKEVVGYLDEPKATATRGRKGGAPAPAQKDGKKAGKGRGAKLSDMVVVEEDEDEDVEMGEGEDEEPAVEEGAEEDLIRRELVVEDEMEVDDEGGGGGEEEEEEQGADSEDEIMGD